MGYDAARTKLQEYRLKQLSSLKGESRRGWFSELWGSIGDMLQAFSSEKENQEVVSLYSSAPSEKKVPGHVRLDYVCGLRREVRKQYVSGVDGVYTDVTPFRHGLMSVHGANIFDIAMNDIFGKTESGTGVA